MLSLNRRNPSIVQVRLPASRRDFSFPFRRFPDFPSKVRARVKKGKNQSFIPGMSAYDSQDASVDVGTAQCIGNLSFSTKSAHCEEYTIFSQTSDVESDAFSVFG